jgi:hypothetical protein
MTAKLNTGDVFPDLDLALVGGGSLAFPRGVDRRYRIALFYRGHW